MSVCVCGFDIDPPICVCINTNIAYGLFFPNTRNKIRAISFGVIRFNFAYDITLINS